ncbi:P-loop containing nucleoside triphosphate hydrolase protein [Cenococcum geophilum 1.58]|uniref:P-loop containing nucleoside triphosphate hydrolase protein n=1 Tax=Cenococcum geophilum 1.58 TaxID=794803 RepID=UPI00358E911A|nr:P-loop containing nucleoside triphosphate hydrolase protein [Cenococcum geophilum 1.58]
MVWHDADSWLTLAFGPHLSTIVVTLVIALILPVLLHQFIYRRQTPASLPTFLLVGPSGAGKTAFLTFLERGKPSATHLSQTPLSASCTLPESSTAASSKYRSEGDPSHARSRRFLLVDTPGHGKLRHFVTAQLAKPDTLRGIIFLVDAAAVGEEAGLAEAAEYLHDVLLALQKRYTAAKTSKSPREVPVLVAANKLDLFTALPPDLVRIALEKAITDVRRTKAKGLRDSGVGMGEEDGVEDERDWLGDGGDGAFDFGQMDEVNVHVQVKGGNVMGADGADARDWWEWVAEQL